MNGVKPFYPYGDTVNTALQIARSRVSLKVWPPDSFPGEATPGQQFTEAGGGSGLATDVNPDTSGSLVLRTQIIVNGAWRKMQKYLANLGYRLLIGDNLIISRLPANSNPDPSEESFLSWNGFWDGMNFHDDIKLPQDFYAPLFVKERLTGQNAFFIQMASQPDGLLPYQVRVIYNQQWEWRQNALFLPGALAETDLQFRYIRYLPNFPDPNYPIENTPWYLQVLPIPGCTSAFAWYIAYEALMGSDDPDATQRALGNAETEAGLIFNDQGRADQRVNSRRRPRRGAYGSG